MSVLAALATLVATPADAPAVIRRAAPTDTIRLQAGEYGTIKPEEISDRTIDATRATLSLVTKPPSASR